MVAVLPLTVYEMNALGAGIVVSTSVICVHVLELSVTKLPLAVVGLVPSTLTRVRLTRSCSVLDPPVFAQTENVIGRSRQGMPNGQLGATALSANDADAGVVVANDHASERGVVSVCTELLAIVPPGPETVKPVVSFVTDVAPDWFADSMLRMPGLSRTNGPG